MRRWRHGTWRLSPLACRTLGLSAWLAIASASGPANGADGSRFECTVMSDQQQGTKIVLDATAEILFWGSLEPEKMLVETKAHDPLEIVVQSERRRMSSVRMRIWTEAAALRFYAAAGDSLFIGICQRQ